MPRRIAYLDRFDAETIAYILSAELFAKYGHPMPAFVIQGPEGENGLLSALALPRQPYYHGLFHKAAALFRSLVKNHPLVDGNKRFGLAVLHVFLIRNGWLLLSLNEETAAFALRVADDPGIRLHTIERWLRSRCYAIDRAHDDAGFKRFATEFPGGLPALRKALREARNLLEALSNTLTPGTATSRQMRL